MRRITTCLLPLLAVALGLALSPTAHGAVISFTVDTTGGATGLTPIANTSGNTGKYAAGSWLTLSGSIAATSGSTSASGSFTAQKAATGSFSAGNPGSLVSYMGGNLLANVNYYNNTIAFPSGSLLDALAYNAHYPVAGSFADVPLAPEIGGGVVGKAQTIDPADYGINVALKVLGFLTVASGPGALRDVTFDLAQHSGVLTVPLTGSFGSQSFATSNNFDIGLTSGTVDYNLSGSLANLAGHTSVAGGVAVTTDGPGTVQTTLLNSKKIGEEGALANIMITVPIKASIVTAVTGDTPATITITLNGQYAAYAFNVPVPEPGSVALAAMAGMALMPLGWRRYRRRREQRAAA